MPLGQVRAQLARGSTAAFYACLLYGNDHVQRDGEIRGILSVFGERGVPVQVWEMDGEEPPNVLEFDPDTCEPLEEEHLLNALGSAKGVRRSSPRRQSWRYAGWGSRRYRAGS